MIEQFRQFALVLPEGVAALLLAPLGLAAGSAKPAPAQSRIKVLLVTGQSNRYHNWEVSSPIVARQLEDSGRFTVTVATTPAKGAAPNQDMSAPSANGSAGGSCLQASRVWNRFQRKQSVVFGTGVVRIAIAAGQRAGGRCCRARLA